MGKGKKQPKIDRADRTIVLPPLATRMVALSEDVAGDRLTFRKKILPDGAIVYPKTAQHPGGRVEFDAKMRRLAIEAFHAGAYDSPTVQLATADNAHNQLPERAAGKIVALGEMEPGDTDGPGLYATVRAFTNKQAKLFRRNPDLGVSPTIVQNLRTVQGAHFPVAIRDICATLSPRVRGLGQWRTVSLSESDPGQIIDLSGTDYEEITVGKKQKAAKAANVVELSDDELEAALDAIMADGGQSVAELAEDGGQLLKLADDATMQQVLSLAAENEAVRDDVTAVQIELAEARWQRDAAAFQTGGRFGVSKAVLDLAEPLMRGAGESVLVLSDTDGDTTVDPRDVVRKILAEIQAGNAVLDLSEVDGIGDEPVLEHKDGKTTIANLSEPESALVSEWDSRFGR